MLIIFGSLIIIASIILGLIILIQNPKGGGLSASFGGIGNQFMGVKQTTDVLEKGTWIFAIIVALLCLFSAAFIPHAGSRGEKLLEKVNTRPSNTNTLPATPPAGSQPKPIAP